MNYAGESETLDALIEYAAVIWDEYGDQIKAWIMEKGIPWTFDKVKSLVTREREKAAASGKSQDWWGERVLRALTQNREKARAGILAAVKSVNAVSSVRGAARTGEKFTVSNVFGPAKSADTETGSGWMASVGALALGMAVGGAGLWAYKKFTRGT